MFYVMKESKDGVMTTVGSAETRAGVDFISQFDSEVVVFEQDMGESELFPRIGEGVREVVPKRDDPITVPIAYDADTLPIEIDEEFEDLIEECRQENFE